MQSNAMDHNCIITSCGNRGGKMYPAPSKGSKVYDKWIRFAKLFGNAGHRIYGQHFKKDDFVFGMISPSNFYY